MRPTCWLATFAASALAHLAPAQIFENQLHTGSRLFPDQSGSWTDVPARISGSLGHFYGELGWGIGFTETNPQIIGLFVLAASRDPAFVTSIHNTMTFTLGGPAEFSLTGDFTGAGPAHLEVSLTGPGTLLEFDETSGVISLTGILPAGAYTLGLDAVAFGPGPDINSVRGSLQLVIPAPMSMLPLVGLVVVGRRGRCSLK